MECKSTINFGQLRKDFKVHKNRVTRIQKYSVLKIKRIAVKLPNPDLHSYLSKISEKPESIKLPKIKNQTHYGPNFDVDNFTKNQPVVRDQKTAENKRRPKKASP